MTKLKYCPLSQSHGLAYQKIFPWTTFQDMQVWNQKTYEFPPQIAIVVASCLVNLRLAFSPSYWFPYPPKIAAAFPWGLVPYLDQCVLLAIVTFGNYTLLHQQFEVLESNCFVLPHQFPIENTLINAHYFSLPKLQKDTLKHIRLSPRNLAGGDLPSFIGGGKRQEMRRLPIRPRQLPHTWYRPISSAFPEQAVILWK